MAIDICVRVGRRIRQIRTGKGISQVALAGLAGLERSNLSRIENGKAEPGLRTLRDISKALGVGLLDLLSGVE
jgi:transcriptional regulator with XRE-family HTH domain